MLVTLGPTHLHQAANGQRAKHRQRHENMGVDLGIGEVEAELHSCRHTCQQVDANSPHVGQPLSKPDMQPPGAGQAAAGQGGGHHDRDGHSHPQAFVQGLCELQEPHGAEHCAQHLMDWVAEVHQLLMVVAVAMAVRMGVRVLMAVFVAVFVAGGVIVLMVMLLAVGVVAFMVMVSMLVLMLKVVMGWADIVVGIIMGAVDVAGKVTLMPTAVVPQSIRMLRASAIPVT